MRLAITTGVSVSVLAVFLFAAIHWAILHLWGEIGLLKRYAVGVGFITALFGIWCFAQEGLAPSWWAFVGFLAIAAGAGLGTLAAYLVDWMGGVRRQVRWLEREVANGENGQPTAATHRE